MKDWYEDYKDLRRDMIRQNLDELHFYNVDYWAELPKIKFEQ